jgi:hypothetical protein
MQLQHHKKYGFEKQSLHGRFDFEFHCLNKCLGVEEPIMIQI